MQRPYFLAATRRVEFVDRREFAAAAVDQGGEMFGIYKLLSGRAFADSRPPHPPHELRCFRYLWMRLLLLIIPTLFRHTNFANISASDSTAEPFQIYNNHAIDLIGVQQQPISQYIAIVQTYQTGHQITWLRRLQVRPTPLKSPAEAFILFVWKQTAISGCSCTIETGQPNNLFGTHCQLGKSPDRLSRASHFPQLDRTSVCLPMSCASYKWKTVPRTRSCQQY